MPGNEITSYLLCMKRFTVDTSNLENLLLNFRQHISSHLLENADVRTKLLTTATGKLCWRGMKSHINFVGKNLLHKFVN